MWSIRIFVCLAALYIAQGFPEEKPVKHAEQKGCYTADNKFLNVGESYSPTGEYCARFTCYENGSIGGVGCPSIAYPPHCKPVKGDLSLPYPKCCDSAKCKESD